MKEMEHIIKKSKYLYLVLGLVALLGIALPLLTIHINLFGTTTMNMSILNLIQNIGNTGGGIMQDGMAHLGNQLFSEIGMAIILPFGACLFTLLLVVTSLVFIMINKFKTATNITLTIAVALCIYAGFAFTTLPSTLSYTLEGMLETHESLSLFASMIDISDILAINLGSGYWLSFTAIVALLVVKVVFERYKKK